MKKINKYKTSFQKFTYTKAFRAPKWIFKKLSNRKIDSRKNYLVPMRIGHKITIQPTQRYLENVIYSGQYNDENVFWIEPILQNGSVIVDIGANIGLYTCAYAEYFKKYNLKIYAIEAVESNFKALKYNIDLNKYKNIQSDHIALGKEEGELVFDLPYEGFVGNAVGGNINKENTKKLYKSKVKMITLDQYANENNINQCDFLKIDVEGAEFFVFQGASDFLKKCRPVVQAEFNAHWLGEANVGYQDFVNLFLGLDYNCALEVDDKIELIDNPHEYKMTSQLIDMVFIPKEKVARFFP